MRRFYFVRQTDVSGTSGTGAVCEGIQFSDGQVVLRWLTYLSSVAIYKSIEDAVAIHGHDGSTDLLWVDDEPSRAPVGTERPPGWTGDPPEGNQRQFSDEDIEQMATDWSGIPAAEFERKWAGWHQREVVERLRANLADE